MRRLDGVAAIIAATVVAGIAGYLVTVVVYATTGPAAYALFAIFWGALYLLVGALSGVQQEITRATRPVDPADRGPASRARNFGLVLAVSVVVLTIATAPAWADVVFADHGIALALPVAIGAGSYVLVATLCGSLYGVSQWRSLALMIAVDGLLRLTLVLVALTVTTDIVVLAWAAALPFPLTIALLWPVVRRGFVNRSDIDVGYRALSWNVSRTVLASASTAVLVSAFPLVLGATAWDEDQTLVGELIFAITLSRAPLIVTIMSLQGYLVVRFRDGSRWRRDLAVLVAGILGAGAVLSGLAALIGPPILTMITGRSSAIDGGTVAVLVASSALVGALCATAAALLARGRHLGYSLGWVLAAVATVVVLLLPLDLLSRVGLALVIGPVVGLCAHVAWLGLGREHPMETTE